MESKIVPDTSVIIDGRITEYVKDSGVKLTVIIPNAALAELEHQARTGREIGLDGLKELNLLQEMARDGKIELVFRGVKPAPGDYDSIDDLVRDTAEAEDALLVTSDVIQHIAAKARGLKVEYLQQKPKKTRPKVFDLFDPKTMSVHVKENNPVFAKRGDVGSFELARIGAVTSREQVDQYARELVEYAYTHPEGFIEIQQEGATVLQIQDYRIVITRPPFSDGIEITAVKPVRKTRLEEYGLSPRLLERLDSHAEGVIISGSPGAGKSTFAQALAEHYQAKGKIVKTMEHPRDLQVSQYITQYGPLEGSMEATSDILLLTRPDYTIYDEVRKTSDFKILADMRLAGVGLIGVAHASKAIDAVQRLVGRVELGMIPHVIDTIIHVEKGWIRKVYELAITVKVPHGMTESDLSRPVLQVKDFETGSPEYELYSFGEEVVVVPVGKPLSFRRSVGGTTITKSKKFVIVQSFEHANKSVGIYVGGRMVAEGRANRSGTLRLRRNSHEGRLIADALSRGEEITVKQF